MSIALNLFTYAQELKQAYQTVIDKTSDINWILLGYDKGTNDLKVVGQGDGGLEEISEEFEDDNVLYALVRVIDPNTNLPKFIFISWCGESAPVRRKGLLSSHVNDVQNFLKGYHVQINARDQGDVEPSQIMKRLDESSGAKYSYHDQKRSSPQVSAPPKVNKEPVAASAVPTYKRTVHQTPVSNPIKTEPPVPSRLVQNRYMEKIDSVERERKEREEQERFEREFKERNNIKFNKDPSYSKSSNPSRKAFQREDDELQAQLEAARSKRDQPSLPSRVTQGNPQREIEERNQRELEEQREAEEERLRLEEEHDRVMAEKVEQEAKERELEENRNRQAEQQRLRAEKQREEERRRAEEEEEEQRAAAEEEERLRVEEEQRAAAEEEERLRIEEEEMAAAEEKERLRVEEEQRFAEKQERARLEQEAKEREEQLAIKEQEKDNVEINGVETYNEELLTAIAIYDYQAADESEVEMREGEMITNIKQIDEGWWEGTNESGHHGLFPSNYVEIVENPSQEVTHDSLKVNENEVTTNGHHVEQNEDAPHAIALFDYEAGEEGELSFSAADAITQIEFVSDDWWQGTNPHGESGLFPANYVELQS